MPDDIYVHEDDTSESDVLHLLEISRQMIIYNDDYKFATYPHNILQEFVVDDEVIVTIHFGRFPPQTVRKLHARHTVSIEL